MAIFFFLVGPASSGKSTIGKKMKKKFNLKFLDADNFHSLKNIHNVIKNIDDDNYQHWFEHCA